MTAPKPFVVEFEHAHRAFRCIRLEGIGDADKAKPVAQWIVTIAGRTVWSFDARDGDTSQSVQRDVEQWWDRNAS